MAFDDRIDALELIMTALKDHEKRLDAIVTNLEKLLDGGKSLDELEKILREKHPTWTEETFKYVLRAEPIWDRVRREVLNEGLCDKCRQEMGEHQFDGTKFICK